MLGDTTKLDDINSGKIKVPWKKWKYDSPAGYYCSLDSVPFQTLEFISNGEFQDSMK